MTRINLIEPKELSQQHLIAEYREMLRLRRLHPRKTMPFIPKYKMGKGHLLFFADKGLWLIKRHNLLCQEMLRRKYTVNFSLDLSHWPKLAMNDWQPTVEEIATSKERIQERLS